MFGLFETLKANKLFKTLEEERDEAFENEAFSQELKKLQHLSKNWSVEKKSDFISSVLFSFEGMNGWFHISSDGWDTIFGLAGEDWARKLEGLKIISEAFADLDTPVAQKLRYIISEAERVKMRRRHPIYNLNQTPKIIFKDFGFKLAVINQLMYKEKILRPSFNIELFAEEYIDERTGYGINLDWYLASTEAGKYLFNLDIPGYLLNKITALKLDKKAEIYRGVERPDLWRIMSPKYFSGGYQSIGDNAIEDLSLLPNLKTIELCGKMEFKWGQDDLYRDDLSIKFVEALKARGITLQRIHRNGSSEIISL